MAAVIRAIVLDIEGTVCPITFVKDQLYPFALKKAKELVPSVTFPPNGHSEFESLLKNFPSEYLESKEALLSHIADLTAKDIKAPYLKALQGFLWRSGYESGELQVPLFDDVYGALSRWNALLSSRGKGSGLYIFSSGSIAAQKLLFGHTAHGDVNFLLSGYFDPTTAGPKTEKASYDSIAAVTGVLGSETLFFSDSPGEIEAAHEAGWQTVHTVRPGNSDTGFLAPDKTATVFTDDLLI